MKDFVSLLVGVFEPSQPLGIILGLDFVRKGWSGQSCSRVSQSFKPGVGQNTVLHALPTASKSAFPIHALTVHSKSFFSILSEEKLACVVRARKVIGF